MKQNLLVKNFGTQILFWPTTYSGGYYVSQIPMSQKLSSVTCCATEITPCVTKYSVSVTCYIVSAGNSIWSITSSRGEITNNFSWRRTNSRELGTDLMVYKLFNTWNWSHGLQKSSTPDTYIMVCKYFKIRAELMIFNYFNTWLTNSGTFETYFL